MCGSKSRQICVSSMRAAGRVTSLWRPQALHQLPRPQAAESLVHGKTSKRQSFAGCRNVSREFCSLVEHTTQKRKNSTADFAVVFRKSICWQARSRTRLLLRPKPGWFLFAPPAGHAFGLWCTVVAGMKTVAPRMSHVFLNLMGSCLWRLRRVSRSRVTCPPPSKITCAERGIMSR